MAISNAANLKSNITSGDDEKVEVINKSNTHIAYNMDNDVTVVKTSEKTWTLPNKQITIKTTITNNTNENLEEITIVDILTNATFVDGSLKIGTQTYEGNNPITGFTLPVTLGAGVDMTISYDVLVDEYPPQNKITNKSTITVSLDNNQYDIVSNELEISILDNDIALLKTANKKAVKKGDIITYTIVITNSGTITNTDLLFTDPIPDGTTFVENSFKVDGIVKDGANPQNGVQLNDLNANGSITIEFQVEVL